MRLEGQPPQPASGSTPLAGLHEHYRKHEQHHSPRMPECEALAEREDAVPLDRRGHDGLEEDLQAPQGQ